MSMSLGKGLMIAAGIGAVGIGGYMLLKGDKGEKQAGEPGEKDPAAIGPPTGTTMAPGADPMAGALPNAGVDPTSGATSSSPMPGAGAGAGGLQGEQVGPYTIVPDPQSGMQIVFETATQQPVGVVDAQGNITPITVDAQGNVQLAQDPSTASALGQQATGPVPQNGPAPHPGALGQGGVATTPGASIGATDADRGAVYSQIASDLFANASNPSIGAATSDPMAGAASLAPSTGMPAGAAPAGAATGGGVTTRQAGEFTLVDDGSGVTLVLDTASQQPVAMMDAAGNVTPISVDAQGNIAVSGPTSSAGAAPAAATAPTAGGLPTAGVSVPTTPAMAGAAVPGM